MPTITHKNPRKPNPNSNKIETGGTVPLPPSFLDCISLIESAKNFSEQTYLSITENRASKLSNGYPTVQFYIVLADIWTWMAG
jgi:hypothetical protein